jgi:uroporphyrinogen decarboxylase
MNNSATSKEIIKKLIARKPTPRQPVALLSAGAWTLNQKGLTLEQALKISPEQFAEVLAQTNEKVQSDIVWPGSGYHNLAIRGIGGKIKFRLKGTPDVQEPIINEKNSPTSIKTKRVQDDEGVRVLAKAAKILAKSIGNDTVVGTSQWGPFTLGGLAYGVEKLMRAIHKDPVAVHEVVNFGAKLCFDYLEPFIDAGVSIISLADPTASGDLISREQFTEFSLPYLKQLTEKLKAKGVWVLIHICGNTTNRLDRIIETKADIMSVDYKVDLSIARKNLDKRIVLAGNLNPVNIMQKETPEGVSRASREAYEKAGKNGGYLLMPGCDIPPSVPLENVRAMIETAHSISIERKGIDNE